MCLDSINDIFLFSDSSLDGIFHSSRANSNGFFRVAAYDTNFLSPSVSAFPFSSLSPNPHQGHSVQNSKNKWHLLKMPTCSPFGPAKIKGKPLRKEFEFLVPGTLSFNFFKSLELMILNLLDPRPPFITSIWSHLLYYPEMKFKDNPLLLITFRKDSFI